MRLEHGGNRLSSRVSGRRSCRRPLSAAAKESAGARVAGRGDGRAADDGAVCATTFKVDGKFENPVDEARVKEFMDIVKEFRKTL